MTRSAREHPRYLAYVRSFASCMCWDDVPGFGPVPVPAYLDEPSVAHHVRMGGHGGVGLKPSDHRAVPLRDSEHRALHQKGERSFWRAAGVDPDRIILALLTSYYNMPEILAKFGDDPAAGIRAVEESIGETA